MAGLQEGALAGLGLELQGKIHHPNSCIRWMLQTEATTERRGGEESSGVPLDGNKSPCTSEAPAEWETTELIPAETLLASLGAFKGRPGERISSRSSRVKDCGWRVCKPHLNKGEQMCYRVTRICNTKTDESESGLRGYNEEHKETQTLKERTYGAELVEGDVRGILMDI